MKRYRFVLLIFLLLFAMVSGCATTQEKYTEAVGKNSIKELENFLRKNPNTPYTDEALKKLEQLYFKRAEQHESILEYERFLRLRASGYFTPARKTVTPPPGIDTDEYAIKAKKAIARIQYETAFKNAKASNSTSTFERFLRKHPEGPHTEEAKKLLEKAHFEKARRMGTIQAYRTFLLKYPKGEMADAARKEIETAEWKKAKSDNTVAAYNIFLIRFPGSQYAEEAKTARRKIELAKWEAAKATGTVESYEHFLKAFPKSEFVAEGKRRIETLDWEQATSDGTPKAYYAFLEKHPQGEHSKKVRENLNRKIEKLLTANLKKVSFSIHRNKEPFMGAMVFSANPFLTGFGTKKRPAPMKLVKPASVEMRRPPKAHAYVVMTLDVNINEEFPVEIKFMTSKGEIQPPHVKSIGPLILGMDTGRPTWSKMPKPLILLKKGTSGKVSYMWIAADKDLRTGAVFLGGRKYPMSKYR